MIVQPDLDALRQWTFDQRSSGHRVGVVPTMGALHAGHVSLVEASCRVCDKTVATIFVNPTQFAAGEDLDRYPRTLDEDLERLESAGADLVFTPTVDAMYPEGFSTYVKPPAIAQPLEGEHRPEHFQGVTTVVMKLFQIIPANDAFFGQKDFQQAAVIAAMCRDLNVGVAVHMCPIVRQPDGLAMSSRNRYLDTDQRQRALALYRALGQVQGALRQGQRDVAALQSMMRATLIEAPVDSIDYCVIVDPTTLSPLARVDRPAVALIAAHVGTTRLIDNMLLDDSDGS